MRALDETFLNDLKDGILAPLTDAVLSDTNLCLELRGDYINIYYRGGNLMKVGKGREGYKVTFDRNYFRNEKGLPGIELNSREISREEDTKKWIADSPRLKQAMDRYFSRRRKDEREFQQLLIRENNFGRVASYTDYFICDIEYQYQRGFPRFDAVAVHWPSESRSVGKNRRLVFIEMKYGDASLGEKAGLHQHIEDVNAFLAGPSGYVENVKEDMMRVFNQKRRLALIDCKKDLGGFGSDERPLLLLVLANHDPGSAKLRGLLEEVPESPHAELRIATASFLGYGLYDQGVHTVDEAFGRFGDYVHKDLSPNAKPEPRG